MSGGGGSKAPAVGKKDLFIFLSLGVHFTADKKRRTPAHSCKSACNAGIIHLKFLIHPAFIKGIR